MLANLHAYDLGANDDDRLETTRSAHMRQRPELHETLIEIVTETETDYCRGGGGGLPTESPVPRPRPKSGLKNILVSRT